MLCKGAAVDALPFCRFPQPLSHAGKRLWVFEKPRLRRGDRFDRVQKQLAEGIPVNVERSPAGEGLAQKSALLAWLDAPQGHYEVQLDDDSREYIFVARP